MAVAGLCLATAAAADEGLEEMRGRVESIRQGHEVRVGARRIASTFVLPALYEQRGFALAWTRPGAAEELLEAVRGAAADGLDPNDYHRPEIERRLARPPASEAERVELDLLLTDALVRLAYHLSFGKVDPERLHPRWSLARDIRELDPVEAIRRAIEAPDVVAAVEAFRPSDPIYRSFLDALARYRAIAARGGFEPVPPGPKLELGARDPRVAALRRRLAAEGDLAEPAADELGFAADELSFDPALAEAVKRFQRRHDLEPDGVVGAATLAALAVPVERRIDAIRASLERARWVLHAAAPDMVLVDVAGFHLHLFRDGVPVWETRVVVGRPYRETPVFRSEIRTLVLNPSWTVPPTILTRDILPAARRDPRSVTRKRLRVIDSAGRDVDALSLDWSRWGSAGDFPYQLRQDPGPTNPLGRVKFLLPNPYTVYLHDTPNPELFQRPVRAASSGCIRVENPLELAVRVLDDPVHWSREILEREIAAGGTRHVELARPVPIIVMYWTVDFTEDGAVVFHQDLYGRDVAVLRGLAADFSFRRPPGAERLAR